MAQSIGFVEFGQGETFVVGFDSDEAGEQVKRLLSVGLHARKCRIWGAWDRFKVTTPDPANTDFYDFADIPLYSVQEITQVISASRYLPIAPAHKSVSRQRDGELKGQGHFFDEVC